MAVYLSEKQRNIVVDYVANGIPLEDAKYVDRSTIRDTHIAEHIFELMSQDPTLNVRATIRGMRILDKQQIRRIEEIIEILLEHTSTMSRARAQHIVEQESLRMIKFGESTGDWHAVQAGTKNLIAAHQLDQAEQEVDRVKETWLLPMVMKPVEIVGDDKHSLTEQQKDALLEKYGAKRSEAEIILREKEQMKREQYSREAEAMELPTEE